MVKNTKKRGKKVAPRKRVAIPRGLQLDRAAVDYAKLLTNPCAGPLVSGPFGDGAGGVVSRFEGDFLINTGGTETAAAYTFIPSQATGYVAVVPLVSGATVFTPTASINYSPGSSFMGNQAGTFRCLAACIQVYWPGSELNRAGIVSLTQCGAADSISPSTVDGVRTGSVYTERTPETMAEIVWRPNNYDLEYSVVNQAFTTNATGKATALRVSGAGLTAGIGLRIRVVAVYEWVPLTSNAATSGLVTVPRSSNPSHNTFSDVLRYADSFGDWMYHGAMDFGKAASSMYRGVRAVGQVAYGGAKLAALMAG